MHYDESRRRRINGDLEVKIDRLERQVTTIRNKLGREREVLKKHEGTLESRRERDLDITTSSQRVEKKKAVIETLEAQLREKELMIGRMRGGIKQVVDFNPVQDQVDRLPSRYMLVGSTPWDLPSSRFKTFQDIFTPAKAKIVPRDRQKRSRYEYNRLSLDPCPVDPDRIPDWFMEEFGLGDLEEKDEFEKLQTKTAAIPGVRRIFSHATPLTSYATGGSHRVQRIEDYDEAHDGKILVAHYMGRRKKESQRKIMQVFKSAYDAHRSTLYIDEGYSAEQEKIQAIRARVEHIRDELIGMKKDDPKLPELKEALAHEVEILQHVTNRYKGEAKDILEDVMDIKDRLGKHNPGATCARIVRALGVVEKRLPEIYQKARYISRDEKTLEGVVLTQSARLHKEQLDWRGVCELLQAGKTKEAKRRFKRFPSLDGLDVRPFSLYAVKLQGQRDSIKDGMEAQDRAFVEEQAINAYVICKVFEVQKEREKVLQDIAKNPMQTTIESLLVRARDIQAVVGAREVFPDVTTSYVEAYSELEKRINDLVRGLEYYNRQELSEAERMAMYERLKTYLEEIDFEEILENLK